MLPFSSEQRRMAAARTDPSLKHKMFVLDLRQKLAEAEDMVECEIAAAKDKAEAKLAVLEATERLDSRRAELRDQMRVVAEEGATKYMQLAAERDVRLSALNAERARVHEEVMAHLPFWMIRFDYMQQLAWNHGHAHAGGWRAQFRAMAAEVAELFADDGDKAGLLIPLDKCILNVNAWPGSQMKAHLLEIRAQAHEIELKRPSRYSEAYKALRAKDEEVRRYMQESKRHMKRQADSVTKAKEASIAEVAEGEARVAALRQASTNHQKALVRRLAELRGGIPPMATSSFLPSWEDGPSLPQSTPPSVTANAKACKRLGAEVDDYVKRVAPSQAASDFRKWASLKLTECSRLGAWKAAFALYKGLRGQRVTMNEALFSLMLTSCRSAQPPNSAAAAAVLSEMRSMGFKIGVSFFNRVINTCRLAKTWRRALVVFKAMLGLGIKPNTASFDLIGEACATANADDAPDVYVAMKHAGAPELLCYTSSMRCIFGTSVTWGPKTNLYIAAAEAGVEPSKPSRKPKPTRGVTFMP